MCNKASPLTRVFSSQAFAKLYATLPCLVDDPENREKRQELLLASYLAAIALFNSGSGIAGALSYPLGVYYGVPNGIGGGIFIASVVEFNVQRGYTDLEQLAAGISVVSGVNTRSAQSNLAGSLRKLAAKLDVPRNMSRWGVSKAQREDLLKIITPLQGAFDQNPVPFSAADDLPAFLDSFLE